MKLLLKRFLVPSGTTQGKRYVVSCVEGTGHGGIGVVRIAVACTCIYFDQRIRACKHMREVESDASRFQEVA